MNKIKLWFRAVFGFSQTEINGFIILSIIMVLLLIAPFLYSSIYASKKVNSENDNKILAELLQKASDYKSAKFSENKSKVSNKKVTKVKSKKPQNHILKSENEQLNESNSEWIPNKYKKEISPFEINSADTNAFKQIKRIGSKLSKRIINYREKLGGFHSIDQLYEVYGIDSSIIENNLQYFILPNLDLIRPLNLDTSSVKTLIKHPYLDYKKAIAISNYRKQHGNYKSVEDLRKLHLLKEKDIEKISPYLLFK